MTRYRIHTTLALALVIVACSSTSALGAETVLSCRHKTFPNLRGENSVVLLRKAPNVHVLVIQSYGKPKRYKVRCTFHDKDAGAFYCAEGTRWGFFSNRTRELSVTTDGKAQIFEGYTFQAVSSPLGESNEFMSLRFKKKACRIGK